MENNSVIIDPKALVEFFEAHEGRWDSYDISTSDELRSFLADFFAHEMGVNGGEADYRCREPEAERSIVLLRIYFPDKERAEIVLEMLKREVRHHGSVTVLDYYCFAGQKPELTHYNWGWMDLNTACVYSYSFKGETKYGIHLPTPVKLRY